jgi:transcriptional regulator with XRE-family HTH domain
MTKQEISREFGTALKKLRAEKRIEQAALAKEIGFSNGIISLYETGKRIPTLYALLKLAEYFNVSLDALCGRCL